MTYDCFSFFNELDLLEIRFNILDEYVDFFVLGESKETFSGQNKPLYYWDNRERFKKWRHKILPCISDKVSGVDSFQRAFFQKENLLYYLKLMPVMDDDIIYFGDLDEMWKPQTVDDNVYKLKQLNYAYYLNNRSSEQWIGTIVGKYKSIKEKGFNYNRAHPNFYKEDGGWHFTNMGGRDQIIQKLNSYDHQEFNLESIKSTIQDKIDNGQDYVGRSHDWLGVPFRFWIDETDLPNYIMDNYEKYKHLFK